MTGNSMIFKIFDQSLDHSFELHVVFIKNKLTDEVQSKLLEPWEMRIWFSIPTMSDLSSIDISPIIYREIKRSDICNVIEMHTSYNLDKEYVDEIITFKHRPTNFEKFFKNEGYIQRLNLSSDHDFQEETHEYSHNFKDIKYLDTLIDKLKGLLRDSSYAEVTLENLKDDKN